MDDNNLYSSENDGYRGYEGYMDPGLIPDPNAGAQSAPGSGTSGAPTGGTYGAPDGSAYGAPNTGSYSAPGGDAYGSPSGGYSAPGGNAYGSPSGGYTAPGGNAYGSPTGGTYNAPGGDAYSATPDGAYTAPGGGPMMPPPKKAKGGARRVIALVLACALVGGGCGVGGAFAYTHLRPRETTTINEVERPKVETVLNTNDGKVMTPEQLYAANLPSCVGITVSTTVNIYGRTTTSAASGSGFILTEDGYIATNYHVIEEAANDSTVDIQVSLSDDQKFTATLVGGEKDNDVAVLKIDATGLTPVTLGDSDKLVVGQSVYAIGNPLGELTFTFTDGMVSALDRLITTSSQENGRTVETTLNVLQTNCAINPGNSGGPLFNAYGDVIGITTAKYTESQSGVNAEGLGFALPINDIKTILADLIQHGYVTGKPYLGVQVTNVTEEIQRYGIPAGAVVDYVAEGSCAEKAGVQVDDIITAIDDTAIDSSSALSAALSANYKAGDTITLKIYRQQQEMELKVTLDEKNEETESNNSPDKNPNQQQQQQQPDSGYGNGGYGNGGGYYEWPFGSIFGW